MAAPWPYPRWIAHRGAGKLAPENTLAAFRLGAAHGYRMYECDAKLSADGVVFLLHDATLERTTNGHGVAGERPWSELSRLDAGGWHSRAFAGEPPCTLEALARHCQAQRHWLNIEIKPTPGLELATGRAVAAEARRLWTAQPGDPPLLTSFRPESLQGARDTAPELPRGWLVGFLTVCICLAISATYELIEWAAALAMGQGADEFLGTQGDQWDTQSDMFLALLGALCALPLQSLLSRRA